MRTPSDRRVARPAVGRRRAVGRDSGSAIGVILEAGRLGRRAGASMFGVVVLTDLSRPSCIGAHREAPAARSLEHDDLRRINGDDVGGAVRAVAA